MLHESPAFRTFTTELMQVARVVEIILHATTIGDQPLAVHQGVRLRHHLAALDHAIRQLEPSEHLAAFALFAGLEQRLVDAMSRGVQLDGLAQCLDYLRRFSRG